MNKINLILVIAIFLSVTIPVSAIENQNFISEEHSKIIENKYLQTIKYSNTTDTQSSVSSYLIVTVDPSVVYVGSHTTIKICADTSDIYAASSLTLTLTSPGYYSLMYFLPSTNYCEFLTPETSWLYPRVITITASAPGYTSGTITLNVISTSPTPNPTLQPTPSLTPTPTPTQTPTPTVTPTPTTTIVIRNMVLHMAPGSSYKVKLTMNIYTPIPSGVIIEEHYPVGWTASLLDNGTGGSATISGGFKWVFFGTGVQTQTITYKVNVPAGASGTAVFNGKVKEGISEANINGISSVIIGNIPGDRDGNGKVDDLELLAYIQEWANGNVSDMNLLEAIENWSL